jgi:hypothetical protein
MMNVSLGQGPLSPEIEPVVWGTFLVGGSCSSVPGAGTKLNFRGSRSCPPGREDCKLAEFTPGAIVLLIQLLVYLIINYLMLLINILFAFCLSIYILLSTTYNLPLPQF